MNEIRQHVDLPGSLQEALFSLTHYDLHIIRQRFEIKGISSLRKAELAAELAVQIPLRLRNFLSKWDQERYDILKTLVANPR